MTFADLARLGVCAQLGAAGVRVPAAYAVEQRPNERSPLESRFALLLSAFSMEAGWSQQGELSLEASVRP